MFDLKTVLEDMWPDSDFGGAADYQAVYDQIDLAAKVRDPRQTDLLSDLEREYGIVPDLLLTDAVRRNFLRHVKYKLPDTASWEHLQNALVDAGFTNLIVTPNNPVVDPADVTGGELLVNGVQYTDQNQRVCWVLP
jgi:hypothetical protein